VAGDEGNHGEHDGGQETEYRNGLENVEEGDHPGLNTLVVSGGVSVADSEREREQVGDAHAHDGVKSVERKRADGVGNGNDRDGLA